MINWILVAIRLLMPVNFGSSVISVENIEELQSYFSKHGMIEWE